MSDLGAGTSSAAGQFQPSPSGCTHHSKNIDDTRRCAYVLPARLAPPGQSIVGSCETPCRAAQFRDMAANPTSHRHPHLTSLLVPSKPTGPPAQTHTRHWHDRPSRTLGQLVRNMIPYSILPNYNVASLYSSSQPRPFQSSRTPLPLQQSSTPTPHPS